MPRYIFPATNPGAATLRRQAARRRQALVAAGCATYTLGARGGQSAIVCLCCGLGSADMRDIARRSCGFCREFHSEEQGEEAGDARTV
jgi:hypothetical protein